MSFISYYLKTKLYNFVPRSLNTSGENTNTETIAQSTNQPINPAICRFTRRTITPMIAQTKKIGPNWATNQFLIFTPKLMFLEPLHL